MITKRSNRVEGMRIHSEDSHRVPMFRGEEEAVAEVLIRRRVEDCVKVVRAKDINGVMSLYAPNIVSSDIIPPLRYVEADNKRRAWQEAFAEYGPITFEIRDLNVMTHDELAFVHSLNHVNGILASGHISICGCVGQRVSGESMASGWLCTTTCRSQQTSSMARLF